MITGPEEGAAAGHGGLRASHADREHVIDTLKTAFADGRLDKDELDDRVGQTLAARTYAELATVTADIPAGPAQAALPHRAARPPVNKEAVKWSLAAAGAMIPPAMFVTAAFGALTPLAFLAMPLLFIEMIVVIIFVTITLANQRKDRSRASRGQLPPRPSAHQTRTEQARTDPPVRQPRPDRPGAELNRLVSAASYGRTLSVAVQRAVSGCARKQPLLGYRSRARLVIQLDVHFMPWFGPHSS